MKLLAEQDGIHLPKFGGRAGTATGESGFAAGRTSFERERIDTESNELAREAPLRTWIVSDALGIVGLLTREQLESAAKRRQSWGPGEHAFESGEFPHVHADHSLDDTLERMAAFHVDVLPGGQPGERSPIAGSGAAARRAGVLWRGDGGAIVGVGRVRQQLNLLFALVFDVEVLRLSPVFGVWWIKVYRRDSTGVHKPDLVG